MQKVVLFLVCMLSMQILAQEEKLRLTFDVGDPVELNVSEIKELDFIEEQSSFDVVGEWFTRSDEDYETFEFHDDGNLHYSLYSNAQGNLLSGIEGIYTYHDGVLEITLGKEGEKMYWHVTAHSQNHFTRTTSSGKNVIFYKVQDNYNMTTVDAPIVVGNPGDEVVFIDNFVCTLEDNKIKSLQQGKGYVLVNDSQLNTIVAYRINVEYKAGEVIDFTKYFKKTKDEIIAEFGTPDATQVSGNMDLLGYTNGFNAEISRLTFVFDVETGLLYQIQPVFRGPEENDVYKEYIKERYIPNTELSDTNSDSYLDTDDISTAKVWISIRREEPFYINYMDLESIE